MKLLRGGSKDKVAVLAAAVAILMPAALQSVAAPPATTPPAKTKAASTVKSGVPVRTGARTTAQKSAAKPVGAPATFNAPTGAPSYAKSKAAYMSKNYAEAAKHLQAAMEEDPKLKQNCECRLNLGRSLCKIASALPKTSPDRNPTYKKAASELRKAIRVGRGSVNAREANIVLMSLPHEFIAPKSGDDTPMIAMANGIRGLDSGIGGEEPKPKILEFYASWCEPCKKLKPFMKKVKDDYGNQLEVMSYNVDDPNVEKIVEDYEVSPIPTLIFLDPSNQVVSYSIGYSGEVGLKKGLKKINVVPPSTTNGGGAPGS